MNSRILTAVMLALSMLAVAFVATPTSAAVYYTGSVQATDDTGTPKTVFIEGERIYVGIELFYQGEPYAGDLYVELYEPDYGVIDTFYATADDPETGIYNSWSAGPARWLDTWGAWMPQETVVLDIIVYVDDWWWVEFARTQIILKQEGLTLEPEGVYTYYPGLDVTITLVTGQTADFYVQIVNDTWEDLANWTNQEAVEGVWTTTWTIPADTQDGTYWVYVRAELDDSFWYWTSFYIMMYELMVDSNRYYFLPGDTVTIIYETVDISTMTTYTDATIEWRAEWYNESGNLTWDSGILSGASGTIDFEMPTNIALYSDLWITFWANDSEDRSVEEWLYFYLGQLGASLEVYGGTMLPGEVVSVDVEAWVGWDSLPGADVDISVELDGVEIPAYGVSNLVTNIDGEASHEFTLSEDAAKGSYVVTAVVSKVGYSVTRMATFEVEWDGYLEITFDKEYYYSGDTMVVTFTPIWNNEEMPSAPVIYFAYGTTGLMTTGNTNTGSAAISIPSDYVGNIEVYAAANMDGFILESAAWTDVIMASVVLQASADQYRPGETIEWVYEIVTHMSSGTLSYSIVDDHDVEVASAELSFATSGSFSYTVPEIDASSYYTATLTMEDGMGNIESASARTWLWGEYEIVAWLSSGSGYVGGAFEPGVDLTFDYTIAAYTGAGLDTYMVIVYTPFDGAEYSFLVSGTSGTFTLSVPDDANDGTYWVYFYLYDPIEDDYLDGDSASFTVKADQSAWDRSVGGMSLFDLLVLVLLLVIIIVLIIMPMVKGRMGAKAEKAEPVAMPPPPAEPPK